MGYGVQKRAHILLAPEGKGPQDSGPSEGLAFLTSIRETYLKGQGPSDCFEL